MYKTEVRWNSDIFHRMGEAQAETRNGAPTVTPNVRTHRSATSRQHHLPSAQKPSPSTRGQTFNNLSQHLVQNIGQARRRRQVVAGKLPCHYSSVAVG